MQSGDSLFDRRFYLDCEIPAFARGYFSREAVRDAVTALSDAGFTRVRQNGNDLDAEKRPFRPGRDPMEGETVTAAVEALATLARESEDVQPTKGHADTGWRVRQRLSFGLAGAGPVVAMGGIALADAEYPPLDPWALALASLRFSLPALLLFLVVSVRLLKGRSSSHREWLLAVLLAIPGYPLAGYGAMASLNGWLDHTPATLHQATVSSRRHIGGKSPKWYMSLPSWRIPGTEEEIRVSASFYQQLRPHHSRVEVTTHAGRFRYPWLAGYRLLPAPPTVNGSLRSRTERSYPHPVLLGESDRVDPPSENELEGSLDARRQPILDCHPAIPNPKLNDPRQSRGLIG